MKYFLLYGMSFVFALLLVLLLRAGPVFAQETGSPGHDGTSVDNDQGQSSGNDVSIDNDADSDDDGSESGEGTDIESGSDVNNDTQGEISDIPAPDASPAPEPAPTPEATPPGTSPGGTDHDSPSLGSELSQSAQERMGDCIEGAVAGAAVGALSGASSGGIAGAGAGAMTGAGLGCLGAVIDGGIKAARESRNCTLPPPTKSRFSGPLPDIRK